MIALEESLGFRSSSLRTSLPFDSTEESDKPLFLFSDSTAMITAMLSLMLFSTSVEIWVESRDCFSTTFDVMTRELSKFFPDLLLNSVWLCVGKTFISSNSLEGNSRLSDCLMLFLQDLPLHHFDFFDKKRDTIMLLDDASGSEMKGSHRSQGSESSLRRMNELTGSDMNDSEFISVLCLSKVFKRRSVYSTVVLQERKKFGSCLWCLISTAIMCCSIVVGITRFNVWASFCSLFKKKEGESLICDVDALFDVLLSGTVNH